MLSNDTECLLCISYVSSSHLLIEDFAQILAEGVLGWPILPPQSVSDLNYKILCCAWKKLLSGHLIITFGLRVIIHSNSLNSGVCDDLIGYVFTVDRRHSPGFGASG